MLRARGGSLRQVAAVMGRGAVVAALPAAVIGAGAGHRGDPGWRGVVGAGLVAGRDRGRGRAGRAAADRGLAVPQARPGRESGPDHDRRDRPGAGAPGAARSPRSRRAPPPSPALVVLHGQGLPAGGQVNLLVAAAPVLVAVPVVLVMLRLYPLAVRGLLALSARGGGRDRLRGAVEGGPVLADRGPARVRARPRAQPGHLRRDGRRRHHPGRDHGVLGHHRGRRDDPARPHLRPITPGRAEGDRGGPRRRVTPPRCGTPPGSRRSASR